MIETLHLIALVLAAFRLTDLLIGDRLLAPIRARWPGYFWTCRRCTSLWASAAAVALFVWIPWVNWAFALAHVQLAWCARRGAQLHLRLHNEVLTLTRNDFDREATLLMLSQLVAQVARPQMEAQCLSVGPDGERCSIPKGHPGDHAAEHAPAPRVM